MFNMFNITKCMVQYYNFQRLCLDHQYAAVPSKPIVPIKRKVPKSELLKKLSGFHT